MTVGKKRILNIFYLIATADDTLSSLDISKRIGVTQRTIKSDMGMVRDFALDNGAVIKSKRGYGYWVEVTDKAIFDAAVEQLQIYFSYDDLSDQSLQKRSNDILRRIIAQEGYVKFNDIVDELYLSRSSIKNEVKEIRKILGSYNLSLETKPGLGNCVKGSEFDRRLCMLMLFEIHYHKAVPLFHNAEFMKCFECDDDERNEIRHIFLKILRESDCQIMDEFTQRIARYLILLRNRYKAKYYVKFNIEDKTFLKTFRQYGIACDIIDSLKKYGGYDVNENEILALEILLLIWVDIDSTSDMKSDYQEVYQQSLIVAENISKKISNDYSIQLFTSETDKRVFLTGLIPVMLKIRFKCEKGYMRASVLCNDHIRTSPMSIKLAYSAIKMINQQYKTDVSFESHLIIANRVYIIINKVKYDYKPARMIVCSKNGIEAARSIKNRIINKYGNKYFERIDLYELYEMRALKYEDYDIVVLSYPYFSYNYQWDYVLFELIPTDKQFQEFYQNVILQGYQLKPILDSFNFNKNFVFRGFSFESMKSFIKLISFKHGKEPYFIRNIENELNACISESIYCKICFLFINHKYVDDNIFEIYQLDEIMSVNGEEISHIIVMSVDFNDSLRALRFIEHLTHQLVIDKENIYLLTESENMDNAIYIVRKEL